MHVTCMLHVFDRYWYREAGTKEEESEQSTLHEDASDFMTAWGPLTLAALGYIALGAWDWTDTVEALAR